MTTESKMRIAEFAYKLGSIRGILLDKQRRAELVDSGVLETDLKALEDTADEVMVGFRGPKKNPIPATADDLTDYEKLDVTLQNLPMTWYPALIQTLVNAAKDKGVFKNGDPLPFITKLLNQPKA